MVPINVEDEVYFTKKYSLNGSLKIKIYVNFHPSSGIGGLCGKKTINENHVSILSIH